MTLQNTGEILDTARRAGYCVGAFNIIDFLTMEAVIRAADCHRSPVILQTSSGTVRRYSARTLVAWAHLLADHLFVPIGLHLDHGTQPEVIQECIDAGYTSVMIDASAYPFTQNVDLSSQIVNAAHKRGVAVEGEIGLLAGVEDDLVINQDQAIYTTVEEAIAFQAQSGVDFLAVAIGTAHGFYKVAPRLDIDTLRRLKQQVPFPLVIHGGTGLSNDVLRELVTAGASKLNISTILKKTYLDALESYLSTHPQEYNPLKLLDFTLEQLVSMVGAYMQVLNSAGRA